MIDLQIYEHLLSVKQTNTCHDSNQHKITHSQKCFIGIFQFSLSRCKQRVIKNHFYLFALFICNVFFLLL